MRLDLGPGSKVYQELRELRILCWQPSLCLLKVGESARALQSQMRSYCRLKSPGKPILTLSWLQMFFLHLTVFAFQCICSWILLAHTWAFMVSQPRSVSLDLNVICLILLVFSRLGAWKRETHWFMSPLCFVTSKLKRGCLWLCSHLWPNQLWQVCGHDSKIWLFCQLGLWVVNVSLS